MPTLDDYAALAADVARPDFLERYAALLAEVKRLRAMIGRCTCPCHRQYSRCEQCCEGNN